MVKIETGIRRKDRHEDELSAGAAEIAAQFGQFSINLAAWTISWTVGVAAIFGRPLPTSGMLDLDDHLLCYHPDDASGCRSALMALAAGSNLSGRYHSQRRILRPDGLLRHVMAKGVGRCDQSGRLVGISGMFIDVTDTVESEREAREIGWRLRTTLNAMSQGILMVGSDLRISVINDQVKHILGLPDHLARAGLPFAEVLRFQEESGEFSNLAQADRHALLISSKEANAHSYTRRRPNGIVLEVHTAPLADGGFVRTFTDVTERHLRDAALAESEQRFRLLAESTSDTIVFCDETMRRRYVSPSITALLGYEPEELLGLKPIDTVHPDDVASYASEIVELVTCPSGKGRTRKRYRHRDGSYVWVDLTVSAVRTTASEPVTGYVAVLRDASVQVEAEEALRLSEQRLAFALESGGDGFWSYDCLQDRVVLEGRWWSVLGFAQSEVEPTFAGWDALTHPDDKQRVHEAMVEHLKGLSDAIRTEYRIRTKSGDYVWTLARGRVAERAADGRATLILGTHQDITERKRHEQMIARIARHDALTDLPNRLFLRETLEQAIATGGRSSGLSAVLVCDLDRFKVVNDKLGHAAGDELLRTIAKRLLSAVRPGDMVARVGGDEFAMLLIAASGEDGIAAAARRIIEVVERPIDIEGQRVSVGISIGIVVVQADDEDADELCRRADVAMYVAKAAGRSTYCFYRPDMAQLKTVQEIAGKALVTAIQDAGTSSTWAA